MIMYGFCRATAFPPSHVYTCRRTSRPVSIHCLLARPEENADPTTALSQRLLCANQAVGGSAEHVELGKCTWALVQVPIHSILSRSIHSRFALRLFTRTTTGDFLLLLLSFMFFMLGTPSFLFVGAVVDGGLRAAVV